MPKTSYKTGNPWFWDWTYYRNTEEWHPLEWYPDKEPKIQVSSAHPRWGSWKSLLNHLESKATQPTNWVTDWYLLKDLWKDYDELYAQFWIQFEPGAIFDANRSSKLFRIMHHDEWGSYSSFFSDWDNAPIYVFNYSHNIYWARQMHAFRCDDQESNYYCTNPAISGMPRSIFRWDMSANYLWNAITKITTADPANHKDVFWDTWVWQI